MRRILLGWTVLFIPLTLSAATIKGKITDKDTGEELIGSTIYIKGTTQGTVSGLNGTYVLKNVPSGKVILVCSYISYETIEKAVNVSKSTQELNINFTLSTTTTDINEVVFYGYHDKSTEASARMAEQASNAVINMLSAKAIELSPDLTVANAISRVSGISIEKSSTGEAQYAVLRGMDKRYNYTLVNGIKIPGTDLKYRYVPLDLFPSELVDRLEVHKALTPDMEGDAIGGAVNLVMKDAPDKLEIKANAAVGYSQMFFDRDYQSFNSKVINYKSPYELYGNKYDASFPKDFPTANLAIKESQAPPGFVGGFSIGNRFLHKRLGIILAASLQNNYKGATSLLINEDNTYQENSLPFLTKVSDRVYYLQQTRAGIHMKMDYILNKRNKIQWYNFVMGLKEQQIRQTYSTNIEFSYLPEEGTMQTSYSTRFRLNNQHLYNTTLHGEHRLTNWLEINWSGVFSYAKNETPDEDNIDSDQAIIQYVPQENWITTDANNRRWEHNSDMDWAGYLDVIFRPDIFNTHVEIKAGGLYRDKTRNSFYNNYQMYPYVASKVPINQQYYAEKGVDWNDFTEIVWRVNNPRGSVATALTFGAYEQIAAGYFQVKFSNAKMQVLGGVRAEHTNQGYNLKYPIGEPRPDGNQTYLDLLPSLHLKYHLSSRSYLRASYFKGINRPGFLEIVPYKTVFEDHLETGNPDIKHTVAHNFDLRYELFPNNQDQLLVGVFYKNIINPIEYTTVLLPPHNTKAYQPGNFGIATNYGLEIDYIKYFRNIGIKANYTFTKSAITTSKLRYVPKDSLDNSVRTEEVNQTRPLYGQAPNIANLSLLYRGTGNTFDAQLSLSYTGERIDYISEFINNDVWQKEFVQLDASLEKRFKNGFSVFAKAGNLLNTPKILFMKVDDAQSSVETQQPYQTANDHSTFIRKDYYKQTYLIGIRYKF